MRYRVIFVVVFCMISSCVFCQVDVWNLRKCIEYAQQNSTQVKRYQNQHESADVLLSDAKSSRLPSLSASLGSNMYFGRSQNRTGIYTDNNQLSGSVNLNTNVPVFHGFRIKNEVEANKLQLNAAMQDLYYAQESVALNVMSLYLQVLFCKEVVKVSERQLALSKQLIEYNRLLLENGRITESVFLESQSIYANDELVLTQSINSLKLSILNLSQELNRESADEFDIVVPNIGDVFAGYKQADRAEVIGVCTYALMNRPQIKAEKLRLSGSQYSLKAAKSSLYPTLSLSAGYGSSIYRSYVTGALNDDFISQLRNNGSEYIGLSMSIPIFNRNNSKNQIRSARIRVESQQLAYIESAQRLQREIEQAYHSLNASYAKYLSSLKAFEAATKVFEAEGQKMQLGRSSIFDYNDAKTRMERAESDLLQAKYEFVFQSKIIDFYSGKSIEFDENPQS